MQVDDAVRQKVDEFMAAIEAADGARLFGACAPNAKIFDSDGNLFLDLAELGSPEATASDFSEKMGSTRLSYRDRAVAIVGGGVTETHTVRVFTSPDDTDPVAEVKVCVTLALDDNGSILKVTDMVLEN